MGVSVGKETATLKERQTALAFAYQIVTDKRNSGRYDMTQIRNFDTNECFSYFDMLRVLRVMHSEVVEGQEGTA